MFGKKSNILTLNHCCSLQNFQEGDEELEAVPLNLKSVEGVFYVTMYGMILAGIFVVIEMVLHNAKIAIQEKRSLRKALHEEFKFYLQFGENVKPLCTDEDEAGGSEENVEKDSPPPIGFILDTKSDEQNGGSDSQNGLVNSSDRKSEDSKRSKSKKSTLHSNGRSNTQST